MGKHSHKRTFSGDQKISENKTAKTSRLDSASSTKPRKGSGQKRENCQPQGRELSMMKAARIHKFGTADNITLDKDVPKPCVGDTQVLIKVTASGINPVDNLIISGHFFIVPELPWAPGCDAAGMVEAVGKAVTRFKVGERVYSVCNVNGTFAEYVVSEESRTGHLGDQLSFPQGAGIGIPYYTAYKAAICKAKIKTGETVLIHGASGAVGMAAVQLCKSLGVKVLGTAGTDKGLELVRNNGADQVFCHRKKGYEKDIIKAVTGVDVILDMVADVNFGRDLDLLKQNGRIVFIGCRAQATFDPMPILLKEPHITGISLFSTTDSEWKEIRAAVEAGITQGWVQPVVAKEYPLTAVSQALKDIEDNSANPGNLVININ